MWEYKTSVTWKGAEAADMKSDKKPTVDITPPPEFGGRDDRWSPEDLLVGAVESCLLLTLLYFVDKMKIDLRTYESHAVGRMERTSQGLRFKDMAVQMDAEVGSADDEEKMKRAAQQAEKFCPVSAAVNVPVAVTVTCRMAPAPGS